MQFTEFIAPALKLITKNGTKIYLFLWLIFQVLDEITRAAPDITFWSPAVDYFEHQRNGHVLAHLYFRQPTIGDAFDASEFENEINSNLNNSKPFGNITFGGTWRFIDWSIFIFLAQKSDNDALLWMNSQPLGSCLTFVQ